MSFRLKLMLLVGALQAALLTLVAVTAVHLVERAGGDETKNHAATAAGLIATLAQDAVLARDLATLQQVVEQARSNPELVYVRVLDSDGHLLADGGALPVGEFKADHEAGLVEDGVYDAAAPIGAPDQPVGRVELGLTVGHLSAGLSRAARLIGYVSIVALLLAVASALGLGYYLAWRLEWLRGAAERIAGGELGHQTPIVGSDEMGRLATSLNEMSQRLKLNADEAAWRELELRTSEERFELVARATQDGIWDWDLKSGYVFYSPQWKAMLGYQPADIGEHFGDWQTLVHPDDLGRFLLAWTECAEDPARGFALEYRLRRKDGRYAWVLCRGFTVLRGDEPVRFTGSHTDISMRKRLEEALRESEERSRAIIEAAADGIVTADEHGIILSFNAAAEAMFRISRQEAVGQRVNILMPRAEAARHDGYLRDYLASGRGKILGVGVREVQGRRADGRVFPMDLATSEAQVGGRRLFIAMVRDVSERRRTQDALAEALREREAIMNAAPDIIFKLDANGNFAAWNHQLEEASGYRSQELRGRPASDLVAEADEEALRAAILACLEQGRAQLDFHLRCRDGRLVPYRALGVALRDGRGRPLGITGVARDITADQQAKAALERARDQALQASRMKSTFLASMSHELRTPLNSIIGFSGALLQGVDGPVNGEQRQSLELVHGSGQHLLALINDILDLSKIEAGRFEIRREQSDLAKIVGEALATVRTLADAKGLALRDECDGLPRLALDPLRIKQVLLNLLSNAVKFTERGEVGVSAAVIVGGDPRLPSPGRRSSDEDAPVVLVAVRDTGQGIAAEDIPKLFQAFQQLDNGAARRHGGTGLGLAISRRFVEMHGGDMWVESERGAGSSFYFTLPVVAAAATQTPARGETEVAI